MSFFAIDAPQRSEAWRIARAGRLTGSRAADILAKGRTQHTEAVSRRDYRLQLVCERLTGEPAEDGFTNAAMQWGIDTEPMAFAAYDALTGNMPSRSGFLAHTDYLAGCSLDGHIDDFCGILEIKCPKSATHLRYLRAGIVPTDYLPQITHNLWVTGAEWCDFFSFDPRFPRTLRSFLARVTRADVNIPAYEAAALAFLDEVNAEVETLRGVSDAL